MQCASSIGVPGTPMMVSFLSNVVPSQTSNWRTGAWINHCIGYLIHPFEKEGFFRRHRSAAMGHGELIKQPPVNSLHAGIFVIMQSRQAISFSSETSSDFFCLQLAPRVRGVSTRYHHHSRLHRSCAGLASAGARGSTGLMRIDFVRTSWPRETVTC